MSQRRQRKKSFPPRGFLWLAFELLADFIGGGIVVAGSSLLTLSVLGSKDCFLGAFLFLLGGSGDKTSSSLAESLGVVLVVVTGSSKDESLKDYNKINRLS